MSTRAATAVVVLLLALAPLAACGGDDGAAPALPTDIGEPGDPEGDVGADDPDPSDDPMDDPDPTEEPTDEAADVPPDGLTEASDGAEVSLAVGDELPLRLGNAWSWQEPVVDSAAVSVQPVDHLQDPGWTEWLLVADAPGEAAITVSGEPACPDEADCPPTDVRLVVRVT